MITDDELYSLAIFLGSFAMLLTIVYHFLEVNAKEDSSAESVRTRGSSVQGKKEVPSVALSGDRKRDVGAGR